MSRSLTSVSLGKGTTKPLARSGLLWSFPKVRRFPMKMKKIDLGVKPADDDSAAPEEPTTTSKGNKNVTCSYGIHRGTFPVAGMKVKDARAVLRKLIKIDPAAAAVIGGEIVDEDTIIH